MHAKPIDPRARPRSMCICIGDCIPVVHAVYCAPDQASCVGSQCIGILFRCIGCAINRGCGSAGMGRRRGLYGLYIDRYLSLHGCVYIYINIYTACTTELKAAFARLLIYASSGAVRAHRAHLTGPSIDLSIDHGPAMLKLYIGPLLYLKLPRRGTRIQCAGTACST